MIYSTVTECSGYGAKPKSEDKLDFDLLEIIQELKKKLQKE